jgi:hypothetical protein
LSNHFKVHERYLTVHFLAAILDVEALSGSHCCVVNVISVGLLLIFINTAYELGIKNG